MKIGFVILAHENILRVREVARYLANSGAPVALHLDARVSKAMRDMIAYSFADRSNVYLIDPIECHWGDWSIVEATLKGVITLLDKEQDLDYILNISGSCLPIYTVSEMKNWLEKRPANSDYIESYAPHEKHWIVDGIAEERLTIYHPFLWKKHRKFFNLNIWLWRKLRLKRNLPEGLQMAFGSQWWCLSALTLKRLLSSSKFETYTTFFKHSWIPDESFFQSVVRDFSEHLVAHNLTYYHFDHLGKPFNFYDDHLDKLKHMDYFFARKIWRGADQLYRYFLNPYRRPLKRSAEIQEKFEGQIASVKAAKERLRTGLLAQHSDAPLRNGQTACPYHILVGMEFWKRAITQDNRGQSNLHINGHLFNRAKIEHNKVDTLMPQQKDSLAIRDYVPAQYLIQQIWLKRDKNQVFFSTLQHLQHLGRLITRDKNAHIYWIKGAWILGIAARDFKKDENLARAIRTLMTREDELLTKLLVNRSRGRIHVITLGELLTNPQEFAERLPIETLPNWSENTDPVLSKFFGRIQHLDKSFLTKYQLDRLDFSQTTDNVIHIDHFRARAR